MIPVDPGRTGSWNVVYNLLKGRYRYMRGFYDSGWSLPFTGANIKRVINPLKTEVSMIGYYDSGWS